jgi:hypothetical protein
MDVFQRRHAIESLNGSPCIANEYLMLIYSTQRVLLALEYFYVEPGTNLVFVLSTEDVYRYLALPCQVTPKRS